LKYFYYIVFFSFFFFHPFSSSLAGQWLVIGWARFDDLARTSPGQGKVQQDRRSLARPRLDRALIVTRQACQTLLDQLLDRRGHQLAMKEKKRKGK